MEYRELLELIHTVSYSNIVDFKFEQGDTKVEMSAAEGTGKQMGTIVPEEVPLVEKKEEPVVEAPKKEGKIIKSPLVGTFYVAPAEGEEAFVKVGDNVKKGQVLAIVEAMKLMNEIESDFDGEVVEVFAENGNMVEYGQPLFSIA